MILALRTDKPEAEIYLVDNNTRVDEYSWYAHRGLSNTLISSIDGLLKKNKLSLDDIHAVVVYQGPGSFTGLRIGISVANTLAHVLGIPIVGSGSEEWLQQGVAKLEREPQIQIAPHYGQDAHITQQKK